MKNNWYTIDKVNSDEEYLYIDLQGIGTIQIKKEEAGIVVDIYPLRTVDEPVASTWASFDELGGY